MKAETAIKGKYINMILETYEEINPNAYSCIDVDFNELIKIGFEYIDPANSDDDNRDILRVKLQ